MDPSESDHVACSRDFENSLDTVSSLYVIPPLLGLGSFCVPMKEYYLAALKY